MNRLSSLFFIVSLFGLHNYLKSANFESIVGYTYWRDWKGTIKFQDNFHLYTIYEKHIPSNTMSFTFFNHFDGIIIPKHSSLIIDTPIEYDQNGYLNTLIKKLEETKKSIDQNDYDTIADLMKIEIEKIKIYKMSICSLKKVVQDWESALHFDKNYYIVKINKELEQIKKIEKTLPSPIAVEYYAQQLKIIQEAKIKEFQKSLDKLTLSHLNLPEIILTNEDDDYYDDKIIRSDSALEHSE